MALTDTTPSVRAAKSSWRRSGTPTSRCVSRARFALSVGHGGGAGPGELDADFILNKNDDSMTMPWEVLALEKERDAVSLNASNLRAHLTEVQAQRSAEAPVRSRAPIAV